MTLDEDLSRPLPLYAPSGKQQVFHASPAKFRLLLGAWGSGKTTMAIAEDVLLALEFPKSLGVVYRKTYPALRDTTKRDYLTHVNPALVKEIIRSEGREEIEYQNGSRTLFRCLDDFRKLGSTQFDRVTIDEGWEITEEDFRMLAFGRLRGVIGPRRLVVASNPPNRDSWMYKFFVEEAQSDTAVFHFSTYDNAAHLPDGYIARLETMPEQWRRKFLLGEWGVLAQGAPVFEGFRRDLHCLDARTITNLPVLRGWDFGFRHPACVWVQFDATGHATVLRELLGEDEDLYSFGERVMAISQQHFPQSTFEDYCDVAGTQRSDKSMDPKARSAVAILRSTFKLSPRYRRMDLPQSIDRLRYLIEHMPHGQPLLRFDREGCPLLIDAFSGGYHMDAEKDEPVKDGLYDHLVDALRYVMAHTVFQRTVSPYAGRPLPTSWRSARGLSVLA